MAIDTAQKRASAATVGAVWNGPSVIPDGTISQADRQQIGWGYSGILLPISITVYSVGPELRVAGLRLPTTRSTLVLLPETRATPRLLPRIDDTEEL